MDCLHILAIGKIAIDIWVQVFVWICKTFTGAFYLGVELLRQDNFIDLLGSGGGGMHLVVLRDTVELLLIQTTPSCAEAATSSGLWEPHIPLSYFSGF